MLNLDYVVNGQAHGDVATVLKRVNFDVGLLRPYEGRDGRSYITMNQNGAPQQVVTNAPATLRYDDWKLIDAAVLKAARQPLRAVADLRASGLEYVIPNGMSKMTFEYQKENDPGKAIVTMDGTSRSVSDRPLYELSGIPLPIISSDFEFSARQIAVSGNNGHQAVDVTMAECAARRCGEIAEQMTVGTYATNFGFGGYSIYGMRDFGSRLTKAQTLPTAVGWTGATLVNELLDMRQSLINIKKYGPFSVYTSPSWDKYLDADYSTTKGDYTLRDRVGKIEGLGKPITLFDLTGYQMLIVDKKTDTIRMIIGMDFVTVQWPSQGGLQQNFKVMGIIVPQVRANYAGECGIMHGTAS
jgi:hypothetical protein